MRQIKSYLIFVLSTIFLVGCAQNPVDNETLDYASHQAELSELTDWQLNARVSIQTQQDAFTASLVWKQQPAEQLVELNGVFGQNYIRIIVNEDVATLVIEEEQTYQARYVEDLMFRHLGYIIPVTAMTNWLKGSVQGTNSEQWQADDSGFIRELRDRGWEITYKKYARFPEVNNLLLPSRLTLTNGTEKLKISVKNWSKI